MKKKIIIVVALVMVFVIGYVGYGYLTASFRMSWRLNEYMECPNTKITQEMIETIQSGDFFEDNDINNEFVEKWDVKDSKDYGNLFIVRFEFDVARNNTAEQYYISYSVDLHAEKENNIFLLQYNTFPEEGAFGGLQAYDNNKKDVDTFSLMGCTYNKSEDEIKQMIQNITIDAMIQYPDGTLKKKTLSAKDEEISIRKYDYDRDSATESMFTDLFRS